MIETAFLAVKYIMVFIIIFVAYQLYLLIYKPWKQRRYYSKFKNVSVSEKFYPIINDVGRVFELEKQNIFRFNDHIELALNRPDIDIKLTQLGSFITLDMISLKAYSEMVKQVPDNIERYHSKHLPMWYGTRDSFALQPTNEYWKTRRFSALKLMSLNYMSKYLPRIIKIVDT